MLKNPTISRTLKKINHQVSFAVYQNAFISIGKTLIFVAGKSEA